jgi:uncharacterized protein YjbI with pentapeptide repeats
MRKREAAMSEQDGRQITALQRPANDDKEAWKAYWKAQGQLWRTEAEIHQERQKELKERRAIVPDIEKGIYPFRSVKLSRSDIEWLLATHENGRGPVDWNEESQRARKGLDLRGAELRQEDLQGLPLARLCGGLTGDKMLNQVSIEQRNMATLHLEGANLAFAHLEGSYLAGVHLQNANLYRSHLEKADLYTAHFEGTRLTEAHLEGASLRRAFCDAATTLYEISLGNEEFGVVLLSDIHWNDAPHISVVNWAQVKVLGDEQEAKQPTMWFGHLKNKREQLEGYQRAVRANRQLAIALQNDGLNEDAARFAYRAQKLQRVVFWQQRKFGSYLFSGFLDLLAGNGYKPGRTVGWYLLVICCFAIVYSFFGHLPLLPDSLVFSLMSFHGRGFFPSLSGETSLHNPLVVLAAAEAVIGLLIEISFIATFTQRFFGK